jgi:hypothetical protein
MSYKSLHDQLNVIFNVIGTPDPSEIHDLDDGAKKYLNSLPPIPKRWVIDP